MIWKAHEDKLGEGEQVDAEKVADEYYATTSRFGEMMDFDDKALAKVKNVIVSRIKDANLDRLAKIACSNLCELYFSNVAKYSHGKRLNLDQTDTWEVMLFFVAGKLTTDVDFTRLLLERLRIPQVMISEVNSKRLQRKKDLDKKRKQSELYKRTRRATGFRKMHRRDKENSKGAHKSEKMKATESSRTDGKRKKAAVSPKCTKCGYAHLTRECMYMQTSKRKPKKDNTCAEADSIFELFSNYR